MEWKTVDNKFVLKGNYCNLSIYHVEGKEKYMQDEYIVDMNLEIDTYDIEDDWYGSEKEALDTAIESSKKELKRQQAKASKLFDQWKHAANVRDELEEFIAIAEKD